MKPSNKQQFLDVVVQMTDAAVSVSSCPGPAWTGDILQGNWRESALNSTMWGIFLSTTPSLNWD